jgi:hypothetical protein
MNREKKLETLLKSMKPKLNLGEFVFCTVEDLGKLNLDKVEMIFREEEGITIITKKEYADELNLKYTFIAAWITLTVHSALDAVGLTASFSKTLTEGNISCNVVAGYFHDHIFIYKEDAEKAMMTLTKFSE